MSVKTRVIVENQIDYPEPQKLPYLRQPTKIPYQHQTESFNRLLEIKHGGVEIGTGLGKSFIILNLLRHFGLKTILMTPATSISNQLFKELTEVFGSKYVGAFFDGKKQADKLIVVANAQSLTKVTPGTKHWDSLSQTKLFIADESHQCPAATLEKVCMGVASHAPYRFFFSATQLRNDGRDLMLEGITGPIVYSMTVREGVDKGILAKPAFRILDIPSQSSYSSSDAQQMTRKHLFYNPAVNETVGKTINKAASVGLPVLVLIEEVEQFSKLLPYIEHEVGFAHGPLNDTNKNFVPEAYRESDPINLVKRFNEGSLKVLIGTSCIATGTDILPAKFLVYLQGGQSEIQVKQAIGRGTRKPPGKDVFTVLDVNVSNIDILNRHYKQRKAYYEELYPNLKEMGN